MTWPEILLFVRILLDSMSRLLLNGSSCAVIEDSADFNVEKNTKQLPSGSSDSISESMSE
jgi:hypothetical protein